VKFMQRALRFAVALTLGVLVSSTSRAQSKDDIAKQFFGTWRLISFSQRLADGTIRQSPQTAGYLIYTDTNHVCYMNMDPYRPKWKSPAAPTESEMTSAFNGFGAYCGPFEIHGSEGFVLHHHQIDRAPNSVGTIAKRWFTFQGPNRLTLRIDAAELSPPVLESTLVWERVQK
jgi:hypothetical protein